MFALREASVSDWQVWDEAHASNFVPLCCRSVIFFVHFEEEKVSMWGFEPSIFQAA
jgi:hypothetical protein